MLRWANLLLSVSVEIVPLITKFLSPRLLFSMPLEQFMAVSTLCKLLPGLRVHLRVFVQNVCTWLVGWYTVPWMHGSECE